MNHGFAHAFATNRVISDDAPPVLYNWSIVLSEDELGGHTKFSLNRLPFDNEGLSACLAEGATHARHVSRVQWSEWISVCKPAQRRLYIVVAGALEVELPNCFGRSEPISRRFGPGQRNGLLFSLDYEVPNGEKSERIAHRTRTPDGSALLIEVCLLS